LALNCQGAWFEGSLNAFRKELHGAGLAFEPQFYLGDEWFSPEGQVLISIPFYLAHPRLMELEKKYMFEVEGGSEEHFLRLLRHEAGHCFDHLYALSRRPSWKKLFGSPSQDYHPETYRPHPYSKSFVRHLDNWYAQAHPSEDFAETFAVWVDPASNWRQKYRSWPVALEKLHYVDRVAHELKKKKVPERSATFPYSAAKSKLTLKKYYERRARENAFDHPEFYDRDLKNLFLDPEGITEKPFEPANHFLKRHHKILRDSVARFSGARKYVVEQFLKKITERSQKLNLKCPKDSTQVGLRVSSYLCALVSHYLFTGKFKRTV
jgi:hypothetical protein